MSERFQGMTPEWHKEHEQAFELAQNEAKGHFHRCTRCHKYVCEDDWNEQEGLCVEDAPKRALKLQRLEQKDGDRHKAKSRKYTSIHR